MGHDRSATINKSHNGVKNLWICMCLRFHRTFSKKSELRKWKRFLENSNFGTWICKLAFLLILLNTNQWCRKNYEKALSILTKLIKWILYLTIIKTAVKQEWWTQQRFWQHLIRILIMGDILSELCCISIYEPIRVWPQFRWLLKAYPCPFIQILSRFYPDFILVLSRFFPKIRIKSR